MFKIITSLIHQLIVIHRKQEDCNWWWNAGSGNTSQHCNPSLHTHLKADTSLKSNRHHSHASTHKRASHNSSPPAQLYTHHVPPNVRWSGAESNAPPLQPVFTLLPITFPPCGGRQTTRTWEGERSGDRADPNEVACWFAYSLGSQSISSSHTVLTVQYIWFGLIYFK